MKKLIATLLTLALSLLVLVGCGGGEPDDTQIRVGYLNGPTGVGMAKMINDNKDDTTKYSFKSFVSDNTAAIASLKAGEVDVICLATNLAANIKDDSVVLSINTLNTLFFITDENHSLTSLSDLNGQTVYTCKAGTPKIILEALLAEAGISATVKTETEGGAQITDPDALRAQIIAGSVPIAFAPEPIVSASGVARESSGKAPYSVDLDCDSLWAQTFGEDSVLPMGCIVTRKSFAQEHPEVINDFLDEYKASIEYISDAANLDSAAQYVVDAGILPNLKIAKSAISNLGDSIAYIDGDAMKDALEAFYTLIGVALPNDEFYYEK